MIVPAYRKVGNASVPVLLVPLKDGSHFVLSGEMVTPAQLKAEFSHPEQLDGAFAVGVPVVKQG
jgi:hypothetical protein